MSFQDQIAVMTGDVVNSRNSPGQWLKTLKDHLSQFGASPETWEVFRGDSFQVRIDHAEEVLRSAIWLKATMKSNPDLNVDLRLGIGIGAVEPGADTVTESNGEAFVNSGYSFDALRKNTMAIRTPWPEVDLPVNIFLKLAEQSMNRWTWRQAQVVKTSIEMPGATQEEIGKALGTYQESVSKRQASAGYDAIIEMIEYCTGLIGKKLQAE